MGATFRSQRAFAAASTKPSISLLNPEISPEILPVLFCRLQTDLELSEIFAQKFIALNLKLLMLVSG